MFWIDIAVAKPYSFLGKWYFTPDVSICENSHVKIEDVQMAVQYWKEKGYELGHVIKKENCTKKYPHGLIQFNDPKGEVDTVRTFGHSQLSQQGDRITSVSIQISSEGAAYYEVIVHELGHALGIDHVDDRTDIMYINHVSAYTKM